MTIDDKTFCSCPARLLYKLQRLDLAKLVPPYNAPSIRRQTLTGFQTHSSQSPSRPDTIAKSKKKMIDVACSGPVNMLRSWRVVLRVIGESDFPRTLRTMRRIVLHSTWDEAECEDCYVSRYYTSSECKTGMFMTCTYFSVIKTQAMANTIGLQINFNTRLSQPNASNVPLGSTGLVQELRQTLKYPTLVKKSSSSDPFRMRRSQNPSSSGLEVLSVVQLFPCTTMHI
jgi:hypothetical protein